MLANDPFVGNVSKLIPLPVDHKGPPMRGGSELHLLHQEHLGDLKREISELRNAILEITTDFSDDDDV